MNIVYNVVSTVGGKLGGVASFSTLEKAETYFANLAATLAVPVKYDGEYASDGVNEIALTHNQVDWIKS